MTPGEVQRRARVGVLVSGSGTNLQALLDASAAHDFPASIALVLSNNPQAFALERARKSGVPTAVVEHKAFAQRAAFEAALVEQLKRQEVEIVCLAGFMRILGGDFLRAFPGKVLNIHPALLPAFPGLHAARQALEHGAKVAGCTVHFVDEGTDTGPIIIQAAVPILSGDDEASLSARIQVQEHRIYPLALRWLAEQRIAVEGRRVVLRDAAVATGALVSPQG